MVMPVLSEDCFPLIEDGKRSPPSPGRILLVEDDDELAPEVSGYLIERCFDVERVATGCGAQERLAADHYDLLILDRMLPGVDGLSIIRELRAGRSTMPILVLSALGAIDDRIHGLDTGGDDYLTKPFALGELAARVVALLRRPTVTRETVLRAGPLAMDLIERSVMRGDREIALLPREFRLLEFMMSRPNQVITREMLLRDVWNYRFVPKTNLVDVHVGKLRRKLDGPGEEPLIHLVRATGFVLRTCS
jgi:two-component system, OmpR family, response regulator